VLALRDRFVSERPKVVAPLEAGSARWEWALLRLVHTSLGFALVAAFGFWVWWRVVNRPGDDNPIGGVALLAAAITRALAVTFGAIAALVGRRR
jgi:hypothetical protein